MRFFALAATMSLATSLAAPALADGSRADKLFDEAKALVDKGRYAEACPKLEESQSLDPAVGTQFNLADCYEHVGKRASAHALFLEVARVAKLAGKFEREKSARERAKALEGTLATLAIVVRADAPGLEVTVADKALARDDWGAPVARDAGKYVVRASAPDHASFQAEIALVDGKPASLEIPPLASTALPPAPPPPREAPRSTWSTNKSLALAAAGVGVVGLGVGSVFGVIAIGKHDDANKECPSATYHGDCPTQAGADAWASARSAGNVSTIGFVAGGIGVAAAAVLWLTAPKTTVAAAIGPSSITLRGAF